MKQQQQQPPPPPPRHVLSTREDSQTASLDRLGPAGEQFLKDTPWANPNHSSHANKAYQTLSVQQDDRTSALSSKRSGQQAALGTATSPTKLAGATPLNRLSESPELARSAIKDAAAQLKRPGKSLLPEPRPGRVLGEGD